MGNMIEVDGTLWTREKLDEYINGLRVHNRTLIAENEQIRSLKTYIMSHAGVYLTGYSLVIAHDEDEAIELLNVELGANKLRKFDRDRDRIMQVIEPKPVVIKIFTGDY